MLDSDFLILKKVLKLVVRGGKELVFNFKITFVGKVETILELEKGR